MYWNLGVGLSQSEARKMAGISELINRKVELDRRAIEVNHNYILFDNTQQEFDKLL